MPTPIRTDPATWPTDVVPIVIVAEPADSPTTVHLARWGGQETLCHVDWSTLTRARRIAVWTNAEEALAQGSLCDPCGSALEHLS